jgi:hypothetical protein
MSARTRTRRSPTDPKRKRRDSITRLDGATHWADMVDHLVRFLRRAGIGPEALQAEFAKCLKQHQNVESLTLPSAVELEYARVLTRWITDPTFVDEHGRARVLPFKGRVGSFTSLVRRALPHAKAAHVFETLCRCGILKRTADGRIEAASTGFFLHQGKNDAHILSYTLQAIAAMMASARSNLTSAAPKQQRGQFLRIAVSERFDLKYLPQYDAFSRESALKELARNDQWFQRHEAKGSRLKKGEVGCVGMGIFVFTLES